MSQKQYILTKEEANLKMHRMCLALAENLSGNDAPVILIGIWSNGTVLADKMGAILKQYIPNPMQIISMQMDKDHPTIVTLSQELVMDRTNIVLFDDVCNSGRTLLYALKPILAHHPRSIQTVVLVERMHKLFPVNPNYVGLSLATTQADHIQVEVVNGEIAGAFVV